MKLLNYDPFKAGFATAESKRFDITVRDGFLNVEFVRRQGDPKISAIEIELLD